MSNINEVSLEQALLIAKQYHQSGNITLADRTYRDILKVAPNNYTSNYYLGILSYQQRKLDEAVSFTEKATQIDDTSHEAWNAYGVMLAEINQKEKAIKKWKKAIELNPVYADAMSNLGNALWELKRFSEAEEACKNAIELKPEFPGAYINYGNALASQDKHEEAIKIWEKALKINPKQHHAYINIANSLRELGRIKESEEQSLKALELTPDDPKALLNYANALKDQSRLDEAEENYKKAIAAAPNFVDAHNNLAITLMNMLRFDEAMTSIKYAIAFDPNHSGAHTNLASCLRELGKFREAEDAARKALQINPDSVEARMDLGDILFIADQYDEAETLFQESIEMVPESPRLYMKLSIVLERANKIQEALDAIEKAVKLSPEMPEVYHRQATMLMLDNQIENALKTIDKSLKIKPDFAAGLATKSDILQTHGDMKGAREAAEAGLALDDTLPFLYHTLSKVKKFEKGTPEIAKMKDLAKDVTRFGKVQGSALNYSLFKAHQDIGEHDEAFKYLKKANDLKYETLLFDSDVQDFGFKRIKEYYSKECLENLKGYGFETDIPVFVLGMPRSGTTLTEQIISSHPEVFGAGELHYLSEVEHELGMITKENCKDMGEKYLEYIRGINEESKKAKKITDKMPGNYMRLGQIVSSLPNAKIIHTRRNPMDTCLSCYKQLFARGHYWSYNLEKLAEHYHLYENLMQYWRDVLPENSFLEIDYEDTVSDLEGQARKLIDFIGLEWDDACLKPHESKRSILTASKSQVRQPIYKTSIEAWKRYEEQLAPLEKELGKYIRK